MVGRKLSFVPSPNIKQLSVPKIQPMHDFVQPKSFSKLGTEVSTGLILSKVNIYKTTMISETNTHISILDTYSFSFICSS
jgi:hypothetical protein